MVPSPHCRFPQAQAPQGGAAGGPGGAPQMDDGEDDLYNA